MNPIYLNEAMKDFFYTKTYRHDIGEFLTGDFVIECRARVHENIPNYFEDNTCAVQIPYTACTGRLSKFIGDFKKSMPDMGENSKWIILNHMGRKLLRSQELYANTITIRPGNIRGPVVFKSIRRGSFSE